LGYARERLLELTVCDVVVASAPEQLTRTWEQLDPASPVTLPGRHRRCDGGVFPVEVRLGVFEERGERLFIAIARDVSAREAAREQLRQVNAELEQRVAARTAELRELNRQLLEESTARQRTSAALVRAKEEAEAANAERNRFLATISHELRTPMNGMLGMLELLRLSGLPEGCREYAEIADASGKLLMDLLGELVDISGIESDQLALRPESVELVPYLQKTVDIHRWRAGQKGLELGLQLADGLPAAVRLDPLRVRQVLINLLSNAVKFTAAGSVTVSVDWAHGHLHLAVEDSGVGIEPELQQRVFHSFAQADRSINRRFGGTGLGLAIAKQLVEAMGGRIGLESCPGVGSRFWFEFPAPPVTPAGTAEVPATPRAVPSRRVLVAEDNAVNRQVASGLLAHLGCEVECVEDGEQALAALRAGSYDLLLMDCQMPRLDGFAATRRLRAEGLGGEHLPVVAMTAYVMPEDLARCRAAGMDDHLGKPLSLASLQALLERWLPPAEREPGRG
ncbi:MAG TPA: ATP-binding protein, partial [Gammaproteobacteria bacterium]